MNEQELMGSYLGCLALLGQVRNLPVTANQLADTAIMAIAHVPTDRPKTEWWVDVVSVFATVPLRHRKRLFGLLDGSNGHQSGPQWYGYTRRCGKADQEWHFKLRQIRNDMELGFSAWLYRVLDGEEIRENMPPSVTGDHHG